MAYVQLSLGDGFSAGRFSSPRGSKTTEAVPAQSFFSPHGQSGAPGVLQNCIHRPSSEICSELSTIATIMCHAPHPIICVLASLRDARVQIENQFWIASRQYNLTRVAAIPLSSTPQMPARRKRGAEMLP